MPTPSTPLPERALAQHVLSSEMRGRERPEESVAAAERVLGDLHAKFADWFGVDGSSAVLARAVDRARAQDPGLGEVTAGAYGEYHLDGLAERVEARDVAAVHETCVALLAAVFALLARLIGFDLVSRLTLQIWPERSSGDTRVTETRITPRE
jgi:hypothetical protein